MVGIPCVGNEGLTGSNNKGILSVTILLISLLYLLQLGSTYSYSQEPNFIIRLKSGVEIEAERIAIEDDVVFYLFSSNEAKRMGISKESVAEIIERQKKIRKGDYYFPSKD